MFLNGGSLDLLSHWSWRSILYVVQGSWIFAKILHLPLLISAASRRATAHSLGPSAIGYGAHDAREFTLNSVFIQYCTWGLTFLIMLDIQSCSN